MEKEKDKNEKNRLKEQDLHNREMQRREADELKRAIEASKADTVDFAAENGSPRKSSSFGFLKRGSRSLSHRLTKDKEPRVSTSDLSTSPLLPEVVPEGPLKGAEPAQPVNRPVQPIKPTSPVQPAQSPVSSPRNFPPISNPKQPKQPIPHPEPLVKDQHTNNTKPGHTPRWRSFSFKKVA
jgi:ubiquitin carboxyl-terminal hydrolase 9/13